MNQGLHSYLIVTTSTRWVSGLLILLCFPAFGSAFQFLPLGGRPSAMGGTGVAVVETAESLSWNPAVVIPEDYDLAIGGMAQLSLRGDVIRTIEKLLDFDISSADVYESVDAVERVVGLLRKLQNKRGQFLAHAGADLAFSCFNVKGGYRYWVTAGVNPRLDLVNVNPWVLGVDPIFLNATSLQVFAFEAEEWSLSYSLELLHFIRKDLPHSLSIGVTPSAISGATFVLDKSIWEFQSFTSQAVVNEFAAQNKRKRTAFTVAAGILYRWEEWLSVGVVGRNLTTPEFPRAETAFTSRRFRLLPELRLGIAAKLPKQFLVSMDGDLTRNATALATVKDQRFGAGVEYNGFASLQLRAGVQADTGDIGNFMVTGGIGLGDTMLGFDLGGGYDFQYQEAVAAFTFRGRMDAGWE